MLQIPPLRAELVPYTSRSVFRLWNVGVFNYSRRLARVGLSTGVQLVQTDLPLLFLNQLKSVVNLGEHLFISGLGWGFLVFNVQSGERGAAFRVRV